MMALSYWVLFVLLGGITAAAVIVGWRFESGRRRRQQQQKHDKTPYRVYRDEKKKSYAGGAVQDQDVSPSATEPAAIIEPLPDFDWENEEPLQLRPYKPIYHITMALQNASPSTLILLDKNYASRIAARQSIISSHPDTVLGSIPLGLNPLRELYTYLLGTYLPTRYPSLFTVTTTTTYPLYPSSCPNLGEEEVKVFNNTITQKSFALTPVPDSADEILRVIGETVEDDIFLLVEDKDKGEHRCVAFICCHPSGFDPSEKLGKGLAAIHGPVPSYDKIGPSMERFFSRLEVGRRVKRVNWGIQTHSELYSPSQNHVHVHADNNNQLDEQVKELTPEEINMEECRLRVELQSLMRLPESKALVFSFKTFLYELDKIKEEEGIMGGGQGFKLADAIEGLGRGNAREMGIYKGGVKWGRVITEYLRGGEVN